MGRGRAPCCEKVGLKKGSWTPVEDMKLMAYIQKHGHGNWRALPKQAGLLRCGKSCRLRWINYLRPDIKRGNFTQEEEENIIRLHRVLGNKWSKIASRLPGRTDNEIKNVWNTHLKKRVASREQNPAPEESPPSSNISNSSLSCSNQGSSEGIKDSGPGILPVDEETSKVCNESALEDIIEITIESNLDMWDMLEAAASPQSDIRSSTEDIRMWGEHWDEELPLHHVCPTLNEQPTKRSLSASSSFSDVTYCNMGEGPVGTTPQLGAQPENVDTSPRLQAADIPIEPDLWYFFEDDSTLIDDIAAGSERGPGRDVEGNRWIAYLEKELELPGMPCGPRSQEITPLAESPVQPPNTEEDKGGVPDEEVDPIASYFQRQHSCPSPFSLSFTDISMT